MSKEDASTKRDDAGSRWKDQRQLTKQEDTEYLKLLQSKRPLTLSAAARVLRLCRMPFGFGKPEGLTFCKVARLLPPRRMAELMDLLKLEEDYYAEFLRLSRHYANFGTKFGQWVLDEQHSDIVEYAGPNLLGTLENIGFRRDGVRVVIKDGRVLTFEEYELVHGKNPCDLFREKWHLQLIAYKRWEQLMRPVYKTTTYEVCYETPSGAIMHDELAVPDRTALFLWANRLKHKIIQDEPEVSS